MRNKFLTIAAALSVVICVLSVTFSGNRSILTETHSDISTEPERTVHFTPYVTNAQAETSLTKATVDADTDGYSNNTENDIPTEIRLLTLLNMNYCYGDAFDNHEKLATAISISLNEYSTDMPAYGICVSNALIAGFSKDFYGIELDFSKINSTDAPNGYFTSPCFEYGTQYHNINNIKEIETGYEVTSTVTFYYGGNDIEKYTATAIFENAPDSPFCFRLISAELN